MLDNSHRVKWFPTSEQAYKITPQFSLGYGYVIKPQIVFNIAPYFNYKPQQEFVNPTSPLGAGGSNDTYIPVMNQFSVGIMLGVQFITFLSKENHPKFYLDTQKKVVT